MTDKYIKHARFLRQNQTDAEKRMWSKLRNRQFNNLKFRRQHSIPPYIADFFCEDLNIVLEIDGGQHNEQADKKRDQFLSDQGYRIIRYWNNEVLDNIEGVLEDLSHKLTPQKNPSPKPSSQEEGLHKEILIGKIAAAHGIKGLVKILPYCEDMSLLEEVESHKITLKNPLGKYILAEIEGVSDKDAADNLRGCSLFVSRETLPEPEEGEYYYEDLVGLTAINQKSGKEAGEVIAVQNYGAGDLLEIRAKSGETYLLPFNDDHAPKVDLDAGCVSIIPLEGL